MKTGGLRLKMRSPANKGKSSHTERRYDFRVLFFEHDGYWAAQCLERDIAAQANSLQALFHEVERVLISHIAVAEELGQVPFRGIEPAPREYWQLFKKSLTEISRLSSHKQERAGRKIHPKIRVAERISA